MTRVRHVANVCLDKETVEDLDKIRREVELKLGIKLSRKSLIQYLIKFYQDKQE